MDEIEENAPIYEEWPAELLTWRYLRAIKDPTHSHADITRMHMAIDAHPDPVKEWVYGRLKPDGKRVYMRFRMHTVK